MQRLECIVPGLLVRWWHVLRLVCGWHCMWRFLWVILSKTWWVMGPMGHMNVQHVGLLDSCYQRYRSRSDISCLTLMRSWRVLELAFCGWVSHLHDWWRIRDPFNCDDWYVIYHPLLLLLFCQSHPLFFIVCCHWIQYFDYVGLEILDACSTLWCGCCDLCFFGKFVCWRS